MKNAKRILSALLCLLMLVPSLAACSDSGDTPADTTASSQGTETTVPAETEPAVTDRSQAKDNLPVNLDFGGKSFYIATRSAADVNGGGEETGDSLNDAVYARTRSVEDRLKAKIEVTQISGDWKAFGTTMEASVLAGDSAWQIVNTPGNASLSSKRDFLFMPLQDNKYLDLDQPWWNAAAINELSIDGETVRYLIGDISLTTFNFLGTMVFNKALYTDFGKKPEDLYQMVLDRKWTVDELNKQSAEMLKDVNGNGTMDDGDIYGYTIFTYEDVKFMEYATDVRRYGRGADGIPYIDYDQERAVLCADKLIALLRNSKSVYYPAASARDLKFFADGKTVFLGLVLGDVKNATLRDMTSEYGIIPYPKLDDKQEEYVNYIHSSAYYYAVPVSCQNPDEVGAVLEAMCAESYRTVVELYFEIVLKAKYSQDSQSGQCIDIIRNTAKKFFLSEYNSIAGSSGYLISQQVSAAQNNFASAYASVVEKGNQGIKDHVAAMGSKSVK